MSVDWGVSGRSREVFVLPVRDMLTRAVVPVLFRKAEVYDEHLRRGGDLREVWGLRTRKKNLERVRTIPHIVYRLPFPTFPSLNISSLKDSIALLSLPLFCALFQTLLQCLPIPMRKLSGLMSRWMKFLLCTYSMRPIIWSASINTDESRRKMTTG